MGKNVQSNKQPFMQHVQELRQRLFVWALSALAGGAVGYMISDTIQHLLIKPLNQPLFYTSPTGGFDFLLRICIFFGILTSIPVFTYHLLKFIEPTLAKKTRFLIIKLLLSSVVLAAIGVSFAYFISLPAALHFLGDFGNDNIKSLISTDSYMSFVMLYLAGYALLFQLPLILLFINRAKPMRPKKLLGAQRFVVLGSFVVSAMLTPTPDPINQGIMAGPMIALYELSIGLIWFANRRLRKVEKRQLAAEAKLARVQQPLVPVQARPAAQLPRRAINDIPRIAAREPLRVLPESSLLQAAKPAVSRHTLSIPEKPLESQTATMPAPVRQAPIAQNVPRSVWSSPSVVALAERPAERAQYTAVYRKATVQKALTVDLSQMKHDPFNRRSRNIIDMRPKPLQGEGMSAG